MGKKHWDPNNPQQSTEGEPLDAENPETGQENETAEAGPVVEETPEPAQTEPEVIAGPPPADPSTYEVEKADPRQATAEEALENLRAGTETLKSHSAAKIPGSLIHDAVIPLEKAYLAFKTLMGK